MSIPIIIIAAGASNRLGQPKQLLKLNGETLLNRSIQEAAKVSEHIIVVLGSHFSEISKTIENRNVTIIHNENCAEGMASSIREGVLLCIDAPKLIISICDQPYLTADIFEKLIAFSNLTAKPIIASDYGGAIGVPILFNKEIFQHLLELKGDKGAKTLLPKYKGKIGEVPFDNGQIDIDTQDEWEKVQADFSKKKV